MNFLSVNWDSKKLDEDTYTQFAMWYYSFFQMVQATDYLFRKGSLDRSLWETELGRAALLLSLPGVRQLWDEGMSSQLAQDFVALVEATPVTMTGFTWDPKRGFFGVKPAEMPPASDV